MMTPRYLLPFDSRTAMHRFTDILVIGGGLAGLRAANAVESNQSVLVVTKEHLRESSSNYAQGGIAGVLDPDDCFESHVADTLAAGGNLCDHEIVDMDITHPIFTTFYEIDEIIQVPNVGQGERGGPTSERDGFIPQVKGIYDVNGRLMVIINWNTDLGDAWEWADNPRYPLKYSTYAYEMGVNFIVYAMSH
jgi:hypothetical protein